MIVDTHVHVIARDTGRYPLHPSDISGDWYRTDPVSVEALATLMDGAGVDKAVLVQAVSAYGYDNSYVTDAARTSPARFTGVCALDVEDEPLPTLRRLATREGVTGVRLFAVRERASDWLAGPAMEPVWDAAAELDMRVVVAVLPTQLAGLGRALERHPGLTVALDHCGFPDLTGGPPFPRAGPLLELAGFANLHLKVTSLVLGAVSAASALPAAHGPGARHPDPRDVVDHLAAVFGANRLLWGSNFPQTHDRPYAALVELARSACSRLSSDDRRRFLGGTALRLWPRLADATA